MTTSKTKSEVVRVSGDVSAELDAMSKRTGVPKARIVSQAVRAYLAKRKGGKS